MPRKARGRKRKIPIRQGSLADIAELLVKPLLKMRPDNWSVANWLNFLFCTHQRVIREYFCKTPFRMPGRLRVLPTRTIDGVGYRDVHKGARIWIRIDSTMPNRVDVEAYIGPGKTEHLFHLTRHQWEATTKYLTLAPKRRKKRTKLLRNGSKYHL